MFSPTQYFGESVYKKLEVDEANSAARNVQLLLPLKREVVAQLSWLLSYLEVMAEKEPEVYGEHFFFVSKVISDLKGSYRRKAAKPAEAPAMLSTA